MVISNILLSCHSPYLQDALAMPIYSYRKKLQGSLSVCSVFMASGNMWFGGVGKSMVSCVGLFSRNDRNSVMVVCCTVK